MARSRVATTGSQLGIGATICLAVVVLYFAQEVLIPLALAVLLSFLLAPLATRLERWKLNRVSAVLAVVTVAFGMIFALGWVVGNQVVHLAEKLPVYQDEIVRKAGQLRGSGTQLGANIARLGKEIEKATVEPSSRPAVTQPATAAGAAQTAIEQLAENPMRALAREVAGAPPTSAPSAPGSTPANPLFTVDLPAPVSPIKTLGTYLGFVMGPLGTAGLVLVFVVFMLLEREELRDRMIRLVSRGKYTTTTRAINDAVKRISRYLLAQSLVNSAYGLAVGLGLWLIGLTLGGGTTFPSLVLWGVLCGLFRFIPYVGPWIGAAFPVALALAVYPGFSVFAATLGLFVVLELISANVMEPWLYGVSTGMSAIAILVAAVFWTWLWGPVGLLLSTPLTVCIVVLGKHVSRLKFFDVLLGDQPALPLWVSYYQRLLAMDPAGAAAVVEGHAAARGAEHVADDVIVPALRLARRDREDGDLSAEDEAGIVDATDTIISTLESAEIGAAAAKHAADADAAPADAALPGAANSDEPPRASALVLGCPAHHRTEELTLRMLGLLTRPHNCRLEIVSTRALPSEIENRIARDAPAILFVAILPPGGIIQAKYLCKRLRRQFKDLKIVVGFWGRTKNFDRLLVTFRRAGASYVTTSLLQSQTQLRALLDVPAANQALSAGDGMVDTSTKARPAGA